jgi:hypothetical protein
MHTIICASRILSDVSLNDSTILLPLSNEEGVGVLMNPFIMKPLKLPKGAKLEI